jgi:hypothetical protein
MSARALLAWINQTEVGTLQEVAGLWSFQYSSVAQGPVDACCHPAHVAGGCFTRWLAI